LEPRSIQNCNFLNLGAQKEGPATTSTGASRVLVGARGMSFPKQGRTGPIPSAREVPEGHDSAKAGSVSAAMGKTRSMKHLARAAVCASQFRGPTRGTSRCSRPRSAFGGAPKQPFRSVRGVAQWRPHKLEPASNQTVHGVFNKGANAQGAKVMSMNEDRFAGTAKNVGGRVEQGFGRATGDMKTEVEGKIKQATGAAQDVYGQAKDAAGEAYGQAKDAVGDAQGPCRNTLHRWKSFCATLSKVGRIPRWLSRWASAGSSAAWADVRTTGSARLPELARQLANADDHHERNSGLLVPACSSALSRARDKASRRPRLRRAGRATRLPGGAMARYSGARTARRKEPRAARPWRRLCRRCEKSGYWRILISRKTSPARNCRVLCGAALHTLCAPAQHSGREPSRTKLLPVSAPAGQQQPEAFHDYDSAFHAPTLRSAPKSCDDQTSNQ
jgi:uncharacterized protein YjbJ (UPF0337 family)